MKPPLNKYRPFPPVPIANRTWPDTVITRPPIWMSTDLRDGNQALFEPMNAERKLRMFKLLVDIGFKEIEVAFPSASQVDFDFVRTLVEGDHIPDDVTIQVTTPARDLLIRKTFESLRGVRRAIMHLYNATAPIFRQVVFNQDRAGVKVLATDCAHLFNELAAAQLETEWVFQYSPEYFTGTELDFAVEMCDAVTEIWLPTHNRKVIINLPATVELATPNIYADQVEWMNRYLARRESIILSVHPHNDRGSAVAAAELAMMAGAERVEGCLFGNGERTGNVDLVTLALNLYTQGVDPGLDFSDINKIAGIVEECAKLPVHPRHPYVGDLVFTAFSGSHQDAIRKGMAVQKQEMPWEVPYLTIDPADIGRTYEKIIRVNSQSGKGGVAFLLESVYGICIPRRLQIEFASVVQRNTNESGCEVTASDIWQMFREEYLDVDAPFRYCGHHLYENADLQGIELTLECEGKTMAFTGQGNGPIDAVLHALAVPVQVRNYEERSIGKGSDVQAIAIVELVLAGDPSATFGVGIHANIVTSSILALVSGINRLSKRCDITSFLRH